MDIFPASLKKQLNSINGFQTALLKRYTFFHKKKYKQASEQFAIAKKCSDESIREVAINCLRLSEEVYSKQSYHDGFQSYGEGNYLESAIHLLCLSKKIENDEITCFDDNQKGMIFYTLASSYRLYYLGQNNSLSQEMQEKILSYYLKACDYGNIRSYLYIGMIYEKGISGTKDIKKAIDYYKMILNQENVEKELKTSALFNIGLCYLHMENKVKKEEGMKYLEESANLGNKDAMLIVSSTQLNSSNSNNNRIFYQLSTSSGNPLIRDILLLEFFLLNIKSKFYNAKNGIDTFCSLLQIYNNIHTNIENESAQKYFKIQFLLFGCEINFIEKQYDQIISKIYMYKDEISTQNINVVNKSRSYLGLAYYHLKQYDKSIEIYTILFEQKNEYIKEYLQIYLSLGNAYYQTNNYEKALENYSLEYNTNSKNIDLLNNMALAHYRQGNYILAITYINKALECDQKNQQLIIHFNICYSKINKEINQKNSIEEKYEMYSLSNKFKQLDINDKNHNELECRDYEVDYSSFEFAEIKLPIEQALEKNKKETSIKIWGDKYPGHQDRDVYPIYHFDNNINKIVSYIWITPELKEKLKGISKSVHQGFKKLCQQGMTIVIQDQGEQGLIKLKNGGYKVRGLGKLIVNYRLKSKEKAIRPILTTYTEELILLKKSFKHVGGK